MTANTNPLRNAGHAVALSILSLMLLSAGMCSPAEDASSAGATALAGSPEAQAATARSEEALAASRLEAEAQAEAAAVERERQAAITAAEQELAEREARVAAQEARLREERALQAERDKIAAAKAAAAERERELEARAQELREQEAEAARRAEELAAQEARLAEQAAAAVKTAPPAPKPAPATVKATLPPGEILEVQIPTMLSSKTSHVGDRVSARLVHDLYDANGSLVIPAGAEVQGRVTQAEPYRGGGGPATLGVEFTHIVVPPRQTVGIRASLLELGADKRKNRRKVIAGAVAGAVLGHVLGGDGSKNVIVGAAVGAAAGGAIVASSKGRDAEIPAGQILALELDEVVTVEIEYGAARGR